MVASQGLLESLRHIIGHEASIPALRAALFALGAFGAFAWTRRHPRGALALFSIGGFVGLAYWFVQIISPIGFASDPAAALDWAQAGVNASAAPGGTGFVLGVNPRFSLVAALAEAGIPMGFLVHLPATASLLTLAVLALLPFAFVENRTTAAYAGCLALGGGVWPGIAPYGSVLLRPSALLLATAILGVLFLAGRRRANRGAFNRHRFLVCGALVATATLARAVNGGAEAGFAAFLLCLATIILAAPLRAALRGVLQGPAQTRRAEALLLLGVFGGSGLFWWDPPRSVAGFYEARDQNVALLRPMEWIQQNVPAGRVVLASPQYGAPIAAFGGRRVLFFPSGDSRPQASLPEPFRRARLLESARAGRPIARLAEGFSVTHLFLGPGEATPPKPLVIRGDDDSYLDLVPVYEDAKDFRVFRLAKK